MENTPKRTGQRYWLALIAVALVGAALIPVALAKESIQVAQARPSGRAVDPPKATPAQDWSIQQQGIAPKTTTKSTPKATPATKPVVFVKRADATLRQGPERTSPIVAKLKVGDQLAVLEKGGANLKVSTLAGVTGYVSVLNVSDVPPQVERKGPQIIIADKTTPREGDNVTPMRGLSPMAEKVGKQENAPQEALDDANKMESISSAVTNADLDQFLAEGEVVPQ
jgi:hypothetical protein